MKSITTFAAVLVIGVIINARGAETDLVEPLRSSARRAIGEFDQISPDRRKEIHLAASFIRGKLDQGKTADVTFICTTIPGEAISAKSGRQLPRPIMDLRT